MARVEIRSKGSTRDTEIYLDGRLVPGVRAYILKQSVGKTPIPTLLLDVMVTELIVETEKTIVTAEPVTPGE